MDPAGLSVTVLGCCGSYAGPGGACSGYLVRSPGVTVWLDAGSGTLANLQCHVDLDDVDAVVLTHEHPDHWSDLEGFYVACRYVRHRRDIPVYAPQGLRSLMRLGADDEDVLAWRTVASGDRVDIGDLSVRFARTDHPPETLAVRIDGGGRSLGYSADTGPGWALSALGPGLDLVLCEATFLSDTEGGDTPHLSARQAGASARAAGAGRLVITHLWPTVDPEAAIAEASAAFGAPVTAAVAGAEYPV